MFCKPGNRFIRTSDTNLASAVTGEGSL